MVEESHMLLGANDVLSSVKVSLWSATQYVTPTDN